MPSRGPATNQPDGHRALAQELRARGLSGAYQQLVFHDDRRGAVRTLSPRAVKNFWHDGGRWRYRHGALERQADRLIVVTSEGQLVEILPSKSYRATPSVFISSI